MIARDFLEAPISIDGNQTVLSAINFMSSRNFRELLVKGPDNEILIVTSHWLLERGVRDTMSVLSVAFPASFVGPDDDIMLCIQKMASSGIEVIPIVEKKKLLGVVTSRGIIQRLAIPGKVRDVMVRMPLYVLASDSIKKAKLLMSLNSVNRLPVVDNDKDLNIVGVLSSSDIIRKIYGSKDAFLVQPTITDDRIRMFSHRVDEVMTKQVVCTQQDDDLGLAIKSMNERHLRMLPVTSDGRLIGVLCIRDILRHLARKYY